MALQNGNQIDGRVGYPGESGIEEWCRKLGGVSKECFLVTAEKAIQTQREEEKRGEPSGDTRHNCDNIGTLGSFKRGVPSQTWQNLIRTMPGDFIL